MSGLMTELRYVVRVLRRSPGFTVVATLSLALGVGATTALYSAVRSLLTDPLPVPRPDELVVVHWDRQPGVSISQINSNSYRDPASGIEYRTNFSYPLYRALRDATPQARLFAFTFARSVSVAAGEGPPVVAGALLADGRYFSVLGPGMALGRPITDADDVPGGEVVAVLSHRFWQRAFGGDPAVVGRTIRLNGVSAEIIGVTARGFDGVSRGGFFPLTEVTVPLSAQPLIQPEWGSGEDLFSADRTFWLRVMARVPEAEALSAVAGALTAAFRATPSPASEGEGAPATLLFASGAQGAELVRGDTARLLWILMGVVVVVLLIACVNLASLMLARGVSREREIAVRQALGSGRGRLVRQMVLEGFVIAALGTVAGLVVMVVAGDLLGTFIANAVSTSSFGGVTVRPTLDSGALLASLAVCLGATLIFGLVPALRLGSADPAGFLKHRVAGATGPKLALGRALIALQIAISVPLLFGATLLLRTVSNLASVELGFEPAGLVIFRVNPTYVQRPPERWPDLYREVLQRVESLPGVQSATLIENPLMSGITSNTRVSMGGVDHNLYVNAVGPGFLETMGIRLIAGRMPGLQDSPGGLPVGALNETAARELFGNTSPLGQSIRVGQTDVLIVGVVSDSRYDRQRAPIRPTLFPSALQRGGYGGHSIVLRSAVPLGQLEPEIRRAVAAVDPDLPVPELRTQLAQIARTSARERVFTQLLTLFGLFALLLASIGLHGITAYSVARRTSEIGVRVALGARPASLLWLVLGQVLRLAAVGLVLGVPAALAAGPLVGSMLFGVATNDAISIAATAAVMITVAFTAGALPAWRAARLDALVALRSE